jgi:hypothetical protein
MYRHTVSELRILGPELQVPDVVVGPGMICTDTLYRNLKYLVQNCRYLTGLWALE